IVAGADRQLLRSVLRARRDLTLTLHIERDTVSMPVQVRTVAVVRRRRLVAVEGVARLVIGGVGRADREATTTTGRAVPVQQRLAALLAEVHDLLHHVMPSARPARAASAQILAIGDVELDVDRLVVTSSGAPVALTAREVMVLKYLLQRTGRVV